MGIRLQQVKIGITTSIIERNVYDIHVNNDFNFETGYVNFDNLEVLVWRPIKKNDDARGSKWRDGVWFNLYYHKMQRDGCLTQVRSQMVKSRVYGVEMDLPVEKTGLTYAFLQHIKKNIIS